MADEKSKDTDMWTMINRELSLMDMARGDVSYAHENINREIFLEEWKRSPLRSLIGDYTDVIYQLSQSPGDTSYIHKTISGYPDESVFEGQLNDLLRQAQTDPSLLETIPKEEAESIVAPQESITRRLMKALGF